MIEINQLYYLITIVDNDFNLTRSAKTLHVSQPALSKSISEMEFQQAVKIFNRKKGRIVGLTRTGVKLIKHARKVYSDYENMMLEIQNIALKKNGTIKIGIAPVIISTVFCDALVKFIRDNPGINLKIIETGAYELQEMLALGKLDMAVLVSPVTSKSIVEHVIYKSSVDVWFGKKHRFNKIDGPIPLEELGKEEIVTLDNSFMVTYQLKEMLSKNNIQADFFLQTSSWDLILNMCEKTNLIGILAAPIAKNYAEKNVVHKNFEPFFPWKISLCTLKDIKYNSVMNYTKNWFLDFFNM